MLKPRQYGRYLLIDRISTGGMAEVYLAKSSGVEGFEKVVAIKRILPTISEDPDFETMFIDEAKISARLAHSNIGQVFEFGQADGQYYIAMEYIPGKDLRAIQTHLEETDRVMDVPMVLHIISRLCQALDYAHRQKDAQGVSMDIIHRDISPPNVIISFEGNVKLIDFGIAKAASRSTRTRAGKLKGKFAYMSPEQVQGMPIDQRSDVFSLGTLMHELLTNRRLFQGDSQLAVMQAVRRAEVDPPSTINPEVPLEVDRIALKALARDREQRYSWASALRADVERYFARSALMFDVPRLAGWMQTEFAGDVQAERNLRERLHNLKPEGEFDLDHALPTANLQPTAPAESDVDEDLATETIRHVIDRTPPSAAGSDTDRRTLERPELDTAGQTDDPLWNADTGPEFATTRQQIDPADLLDQGDGFDQRAEAGERKSTLRDLSAPQHETERHPLGDLVQEAGDALDEPEESDTDVAPPLIIGPSGQKVRQELVNWPTAYTPEPASSDGVSPADANGSAELALDELELDPLAASGYPPEMDSLDAGPTRIESFASGEVQAPTAAVASSGSIAPGPNRDGATVGGAVDVDSNPDHVPRMPSSPAVDVAGIDGVVRTSEVQLGSALRTTRPGHLSGTQELHEARRFSSMHVIIIAAGLTLLVAGLISVPMMVCSAPDPTPTTASGTIIVTTRPPAGCSVSLDTRSRGILAPGDSLSLTKIGTGRHQVELVCGGFRSFATTIEVHAAEVTFVEAALNKE